MTGRHSHSDSDRTRKVESEGRSAPDTSTSRSNVEQNNSANHSHTIEGKQRSQRERASSSHRPNRAAKANRFRKPSDRAAGIYRGIASWIEDHLAQKLPPETELPGSITLNFRIPFSRDRREWKRAEREFRCSIEDQLDALSDQLSTDELGYRDGHIYCALCASPICEHSTPENSRSIFVGYSPTGVPTWRDFGSWLLDQGDDRLDRLYATRPIPLARRVDAETLTTQLLPEFGKTMVPLQIAGAVVAGYFSVPEPEGGFTAMAISAIAMEHRTTSGAPQYSMNLVGHLPPPHHLPTLLAERVVPTLSDWVSKLRHELSLVHDRIHACRAEGRRPTLGESRALVEKSLDNSANYLEKRLRRRQGRTNHAEERSRDPERPTACAHSDAQSARDDDLFLDRKSKTVIVKGPHNRIHVFRDDGTHITSILYTGETIRDRIASRRWILLNPELRRSFRDGLGERRQLPGTSEESDFTQPT